MRFLGSMGMRAGMLVLGLLALLGTAHADADDSKQSPISEETAASTAAKGIALAGLAVADESGRPRRYTTYSERQLRCLAEGMYFEARGEPLSGQLGVGRVILNRVQSSNYPDTICGVVYQNDHMPNRCQFSFACDGKPDRISEKTVWAHVRGYAAWLLANDPDGTNEYQVLASLADATHYHADYVKPRWAQFFSLTARIGRHIFYADPSA
jgi:spore germination cell wall hydrolase CwlJ-like protein